MTRGRSRRRLFAVAVAGLALGLAGGAQAGTSLWRFDNLRRIGGHAVTVEGHPQLISTPTGRAIRFDGEGDSVLVGGRPLVGASRFTVEVLIRPEGGRPEQRFLHIAETDPATGLDATMTGTRDANSRIMFEIRVADGAWWPDAFVSSKAGSKPLIFPEKRFPLNRWYAVQQTYDGQTYRLYVDGVLQGEAPVAFQPHGPGRVRVGARMNLVDHFKGVVAAARFSDEALPPERFMKASN